jgi:hypothetical protein
MALGRTAKLNTGAEIPLLGLGNERDGVERKGCFTNSYANT